MMKIKFRLIALCLLASLAFAELELPPKPAQKKKPEKKIATVLKIVDGDTLTVMLGGKQARVRLRRLNAPEKGQPGAEEATKALKRRFPPGSKVKLTIYARDKHARIIAEVARYKKPKRAKSKAPAKKKAAARIQITKAYLDAFLEAVDRVEGASLLISRVGGKNGPSPELQIYLTNTWHAQPYQVRLQAAQGLWTMWAQIYGPKARVRLLDQRGNRVGGSRVLDGSSIWVQKQ